MKPRFLSLIDFRGIINCNTFSVAPSIINENVKYVLFHFGDFGLTLGNEESSVSAGNTKGGRITVQLTSCLTGLD